MRIFLLSLAGVLACLAMAVTGCGNGGGGDPDGGDCVPTAEVCNGFDDDCNGSIDDGLDTDADGDGHYTLASCRQPADDCNDADADMYPGHAENPNFCDGKDNDCDNQVDEDCDCQPGTQQDCSTDEGECTLGSQTCATNGTWEDCSGTLPIAEICDLLDNDCDGETDNVTEVQACELTEGVCAGVTRPGGCDPCDYGANYEVLETLCDSLDNDCDGQTDEELPGDGHEPNDSCGSPKVLNEYNEGAVDRNETGALYKYDAMGPAADEDWFQIQLNEADHLADCLLEGPEQCFEFLLRLQLPLGADQNDWEMCLLDGAAGSCANFGDPSYTFCTEEFEWVPASNSYSMTIQWPGFCGEEDGGRFYILVRAKPGSTVTECRDYTVWLQWNYLGSNPCP